VIKEGSRPCGKKPKHSPTHQADLVTLDRAREHTTAELGDLLGVARSSVYRTLQMRPAELGSRPRQRLRHALGAQPTREKRTAAAARAAFPDTRSFT
jgi:hypothetical protein